MWYRLVVTDTALDLDAVVEELLEGRDIEDLVASGLRSVDNSQSGDGKIEVVAHIPFSGRYLKYL
jgi:large subunit ribosomal protein L22e